MKRTLVLVALFVAAVVLVVRGCESGTEPVRAAGETASATSHGGAHTLTRAEALTSRASIDPQVLIAADDVAASGLADVATSNGAMQLARVRGVIVRHDGSPAADAALVVHGWRSSGAPSQRDGSKPTWNDVAAVVIADGSFALEFPWHPHWKYQLTAAARMAPRVVWTIPGLAPALDSGGELDVGTIVLPLGGEVVVRVVRPDGTPAQGPWEAEAGDAWPTRWRDGRTERIVWEPIEGGCGLRSTSVAAGFLQVRVRSPLRVWGFLDGEAMVVPGEVTHLELVYDGEPLERRLVLEFERGLMDWFDPPDVANVRLGGLDAAPELEEFPLRLVWPDVPPGEHELCVNDARFEPLTDVRVWTGRTNSIALVGSVELTFDVRSAAGHSLADLKFELLDFGWPLDRYADPAQPELLPEAESSASARRVCVRTVPDPQIWVVTATEHAPLVLEFAAGFAPGARERIDVRLEPRATIAGHVVDSLGAPVVGRALQATRVDASGRALPDAPRERFLDQHLQYMAMFDAERAVTDEQGAFRFGHLDAAALYDIATEGRAPSGRVRGVAVGSSDVRLELSQAGRLVGRLFPAFAGLDEYEIQLAERAQDVAPGRAQDPWLDPRHQRLALDGTFAFGVLPIRRHEFRIVHVGKDIVGTLRTRTGTELLRDSVWIEEGATTNLDIDVAHLTPATAHIHIRETTHTASELVVCVERWDEGAQTWRRHMRSPVGADGVAHVSPLARGRWRFLYQELDARWSAPLPGEYELSDGGSIDLTFDVALVFGTVVLVDTEGRALEGHEICFDGAWADAIALTTAKGEVDLVHPLGTVRLGKGAAVDAATKERRLTQVFEFEWTATGPLPRVVTVPDEP